jgi:DNA polymerase III subunit epsilon
VVAHAAIIDAGRTNEAAPESYSEGHVTVLTPEPPRAATPGADDRRQSRAAAIAWAAEAVACPDVVYLDTETTGIDGRAEIVEIAVVDGAGNTLLDTLVRPEGIIPYEVIRIHGIDDGMVAGAPRWPEVYPALLDLLRERVVIVYNAEFDFRLVNQMNRRSGFPPRADRWHCAMKQYAGYATDWHTRYGNYRWHKLGVALSRFGHPENGHRAHADALACRLVVCGMADEAIGDRHYAKGV